MHPCTTPIIKSTDRICICFCIFLCICNKTSLPQTIPNCPIHILYFNLYLQRNRPFLKPTPTIPPTHPPPIPSLVRLLNWVGWLSTTLLLKLPKPILNPRTQPLKTAAQLDGLTINNYVPSSNTQPIIISTSLEPNLSKHQHNWVGWQSTTTSSLPQPPNILKFLQPLAQPLPSSAELVGSFSNNPQPPPTPY